MSAAHYTKGAAEKASLPPSTLSLDLGITSASERLLVDLAAKVKGSPGPGIGKGLNLLQVILEAKAEGKQLALLDASDDFTV